MSQPYRIGWLNGKCVLVWRDAAGKRKRYSLGTRDPREATRRAPAVYAELTLPLGRSVAELWNAYVADRQGRAILITMTHTWKALLGRFGPMEGDRITIADCRAHIAETSPGRNQGWHPTDRARPSAYRAAVGGKAGADCEGAAN